MNPVGADVRRRASQFTPSSRLDTSAPAIPAGSREERGLQAEAAEAQRAPRSNSCCTCNTIGEALREDLVGNLAVRLQKRIEWDAAAMRAKNAGEAEPLLRKSYRAGFGI